MMTNWDARIAKLVGDGVGLGNGDKVSVFVTDVSAIDLVDAFVGLCYERGASPQVLLTDERFDAWALRYSRDLTKPPPMEQAAMQWSNVHVSFRAMAPPPADAPDPARAAGLRQGRGLISTLRWQNTRWALVRVPTRAWAKRFGIDYGTWLAQWHASFDADWGDAHRRMGALCDQLTASPGRVLLRDDDTDLSVDVGGRVWVPFAGAANWPDGEIATAPVDVDGHIAFDGPIVFGGTVVDGLSLTFEHGRAVNVSAREGQDFVERILASDGGAAFAGEFGVGTNGRLTALAGDALLDEKILGTAHIALGRAYPECGGVNRSAIHWDIIKDLRGPRGFLNVDNVVLIDKGVPTKALLDAALRAE